ncbi:hypothetical protein HELRODRAFT_192544 [Helobdella robusta]|uniref:Uncharacterized protein n=1 Tax=Helobdella robusta TaxID=6412 RepID=T1FU23_HELRO|nr:hypothetical protein HELRODRAFT_192544 [Helobdella robusta]ESO00613.1 hypothetical protein HELRODRAFT_192544 [Helobdella robusta]
MYTPTKMKNILMMTWLMVMTSYMLVTLASFDDVESGLKVGYHKYQKRFIKTLKDLEQGKGERLSYGWGKRSGHNSHNNRNVDNINNNNKNNHNGNNIRKKTDDVEGTYNVVDDFENGEIFSDGLELSDLQEIVDNYKNKFRNINKNENFGKINNNDKSFNVADNNSNNSNNNNDDDNKVLLPRSNGRFKKLFNKLQQKPMTSSSNFPSSSSSSASYAHPLSVEMEYDGLAY